MSRFYYQLVYCLFFFLLSHSVIAEGITVVVTKPIQQAQAIGSVDLSSTTSTYSVITSDNFEARHTELSKLVEHETGIQVLSSGGVGGFSSASIRGANSEQVTVYVDGVALNQASGGAVDLSLISLDDVESIELYRGTVPMELGNASLGGAINIITKKSKEGFNGKLKATLGSFNTQKYNVFGSAGKNNNSFIFSGSILTSDNDYEFINDNGTEHNPDDDRTEIRHNSAIDKRSALAKWNYKLDDDSNINTKLEWLDKSHQIPGVQNNINADGVLLLDGLDLVSQYNKSNFLSKNSDFSAKLFAGKLNDHYIDSQGANGNTPSDIDSLTNKVGGEGFYKYKSDNYQFKYRLLYDIQDFTQDNLLSNTAKQSSQRNYFEQALEYKNFSLENSLISSITFRHVYAKDDNNQHEDEFGNISDLEDREYDYVTPQFGIKYKLSSLASLKFNAGKYVRLPSFFELFGDHGFYRGSPDLKEETGTNIDFGFSYSFFKLESWFDDAKIYIGLFHNTIDDLIVRETNAQGFSVARNVANAEINGLETNLKLYPHKQWTVLLNATYIDSNNISEVPAYDGNKLPGQFEQDYSLHISYAVSQWIMGLGWDVKKGMFYDRPNLLPATDISDVNLSLLRNWKHHSLEFKAENLLNNQYENFRLQPTAGTSYYLTYMYKL